MDAVHIHLIINHVPVILAISALLLLIISLFNHKKEYRNIAFAGFVIAAIFSFISFESGESAEDVVENIAGVTHDVIENHEHAADTARWLMLVLGVAGLAGLTYFRDEKKKGYQLFLYISMIVGIIAVGYLVYTGYLGGLIRHTELISAPG
ncbi:MAG TPA: DUF2231 domain-containing protein [Balneolaceae bacterium]|nr:DUF2231 domain-containing protein [Balneolaceae bacterium]